MSEEKRSAIDMMKAGFPVALSAKDKADKFKEQILWDLINDTDLDVLKKCKQLNEDPHCYAVSICFQRIKHTDSHMKTLIEFLIEKNYKVNASFEDFCLEIGLR